MKRKRIMIFDDEEDFLRIARLNLEGTGRYDVMTLSDTKDILPRVKRFNPNVILLDIIMSPLGGIEVCQMLNSDLTCKKIPIIIVSACDREGDKMKAYELGVKDYLSKPIETDSIIISIERVLKINKAGA
ncbi:MAG: response regulator [Candidatus Omnitrophota bacterium]